MVSLCKRETRKASKGIQKEEEKEKGVRLCILIRKNAFFREAQYECTAHAWRAFNN